MSEKRSINKPGTQAGSNLTLIPTPPRLPLRTIEHCRLEMARLYRAMRAGTMDSQDGSRLAFVLSQIAKLIEQGDLERRLIALEDHHENP